MVSRVWASWQAGSRSSAPPTEASASKDGARDERNASLDPKRQSGRLVVDQVLSFSVLNLFLCGMNKLSDQYEQALSLSKRGTTDLLVGYLGAQLVDLVSNLVKNASLLVRIGVRSRNFGGRSCSSWVCDEAGEVSRSCEAGDALGCYRPL